MFQDTIKIRDFLIWDFLNIITYLKSMSELECSTKSNGVEEKVCYCKMFSQLTLYSFRIFFTYFSTWNTPFEWNKSKQEIEITKNKSQLLRWRANSIFQFSYAIFIFIRLFQTRSDYGISITNFILRSPQFINLLLYFTAELTIISYKSEIVLIFNQMERNNHLFGKSLLGRKKWDGYGIITFYFIIAGFVYPYVFTGFFIFNRHRNHFLYSIVNISLQSDIEGGIVLFLFISSEVVSVHCIGNTVITLYFVLCSYFVHSTYWLTSEGGTCQRFQILRLHTSRFNEVFSNVYLAPMKEFFSIGFVFCSFFLIRYHDTLEFGSFVMLGFLGTTVLIMIIAIYFPAGWVWKYSTKMKNHILKQDVIENRRRSYLCPFGIMIGSFYVVKGYTFLSLQIFL